MAKGKLLFADGGGITKDLEAPCFDSEYNPPGGRLNLLTDSGPAAKVFILVQVFAFFLSLIACAYFIWREAQRIRRRRSRTINPSLVELATYARADGQPEDSPVVPQM